MTETLDRVKTRSYSRIFWLLRFRFSKIIFFFFQCFLTWFTNFSSFSPVFPQKYFYFLYLLRQFSFSKNLYSFIYWLLFFGQIQFSFFFLFFCST
ncbi:unnamed protein product [Meloidogyne enterolobii]|uniref:Uncharacterized protein n=1 Tax=Meloidogyne enterolobii TaxID=390850 RepID=A0ACB1A4E4_MELEN